MVSVFRPHFTKLWFGAEYDHRRKERERLLEDRRRCRETFTESDRAELSRLSALCAATRKRHYTETREEMVQELGELWRSRRFAELHRLSLRIAGRRRGPKKRNYSASPAALPSAEEWLTHWKQAGPDGGMLADPAEWQDMMKEHLECANPLPARMPEEDKLAGDDLRGIRRYFYKAGKRKAVPPEALPLELWTLLVAPLRGISSAGKGVGFDPAAMHRTGESNAYFACNWLQKGLEHIRRTGYTPLRWHKSTGAALKKNSTPGPAGKRVVHILDPLGKVSTRSSLPSETHLRQVRWTMASSSTAARKEPSLSR